MRGDRGEAGRGRARQGGAGWGRGGGGGRRVCPGRGGVSRVR